MQSLRALGGILIEALTLEDLKPAPYNPREISPSALDGLQYSLAEFGDISGIVWNRRSGNLVCGHQRLKALRQEYGGDLSMEDHTVVTPKGERFAVREVDWDDTQERLANLAANNPLIAGLFTPSARSMIEELSAIAPIQIEALRIADLLEQLPIAEVVGATDPDFVPEAPEEPVTRLGDVWLLGEHRLMCGDSTKAEDVERLMGGEKAALCFTSPPYCDAREYTGGDLSVETLAGFLPAWATSSEIVAVNLGLIRSEDTVVCYWDTYIRMAEQAGLKLLSWNVWDRQHPSSVAHQTAMFPIEHEWVLVFGRQAITLNLTLSNKHAGIRVHGTIRQRDGSFKKAEPVVVRDHRALGTVLRCPRHIGRDIGHPAMFPVALPAAYIEAATQGREVVGDPFCGSGTTIIAAEQLGRRCYAMEIEPRYCDVAVRRWEAFTERKAELEAT